jgi:hypothetical protein
MHKGFLFYDNKYGTFVATQKISESKTEKEKDIISEKDIFKIGGRNQL